MKKLLFVIALVALFSCEKEPIYCWQCNKEIFTDRTYSSHVTMTCDKTESEIRDFEKSGTRDLNGASIVITCKRYE